MRTLVRREAMTGERGEPSLSGVEGRGLSKTAVAFAFDIKDWRRLRRGQREDEPGAVWRREVFGCL